MVQKIEKPGIAVVNFRTQPFGAFKWTRGLTRGYYRVLIVLDESGSRRANSRNVVNILWESRSGLLGVTERSRYWLGNAENYAKEAAAEYNAGSHFYEI